MEPNFHSYFNDLAYHEHERIVRKRALVHFRGLAFPSMAAVLTLVNFTFELLKTWNLLLRRVGASFLRTSSSCFRSFPIAFGPFLPGIWCDLKRASNMTIENRSRYPVHAKIRNGARRPHGR